MGVSFSNDSTSDEFTTSTASPGFVCFETNMLSVKNYMTMKQNLTSLGARDAFELVLGNMSGCCAPESRTERGDGAVS